MRRRRRRGEEGGSAVRRCCPPPTAARRFGPRRWTPLTAVDCAALRGAAALHLLTALWSEELRLRCASVPSAAGGRRLAGTPSAPDGECRSSAPACDSAAADCRSAPTGRRSQPTELGRDRPEDGEEEEREEKRQKEARGRKRMEWASAECRSAGTGSVWLPVGIGQPIVGSLAPAPPPFAAVARWLWSGMDGCCWSALRLRGGGR